MVFNSAQFFLFFLAVAAVYFLCPLRWRWTVLLAGSIVFYGWAKPVYLLLLTTTVVSTWYAGQLMDRSATMQRRRTIMRMTLLLNLLILVVFKYLGFFNELIGLFSHSAAGKLPFSFPVLLLPIGISFYTFQSIGYVLDVYFKVRKPEPHFGYYTVFVAFFPQILSGPIGRSTELLPQIRNQRKTSWEDIESGISRFSWGIFKKMVIADRLSLVVDDVYGNPSSHQGMVFWFVTVLYAFQLYADFSGYTDMAIGVARIFGIRLAENFDFPYISKNVTEFWRRWHLSLSNWLRDYLYTPIMFSKKKWGKKAVMYAIVLTFLICGIWHGAKLTFVIFGVLQAGALLWEMLSRELRARWSRSLPKKAYGFFSWLLTFFFVVFCFIFFRADTTKDALLIVKREFTSFTDLGDFKAFLAHLNYSRIAFTLLCCFAFFVIDKPVSLLIRNEATGKSRQRALLAGVFIALTLALGVFGKADFIYFKF